MEKINSTIRSFLVFSFILNLAFLPLLFGQTIDPIPEEEGLSGFVNFGGAWIQMKSNTVAGSRFGDTRIDSIYKKSDSKSSALPIINGEIRYTFAESETQLFLGNAIEDWLRFDLSTALGVRHQMEGKGIFEGAFLFSAIPTEVWEDPYVAGLRRDRTDRTSIGGRLGWSRILDSNFHASYSYRDIEIDHERSGTFLGLDPAQRDLLRREGASHRAELVYTHQLSDNQWIAPTFYYTRLDLDGDAMSNDMYSFMLTHTFATRTFRVLSNLVYGFSDYEERNPIYQKTQKSDRYGISTTLLYPNLFKVKNLTGVIGAAYWLEDTNIDFYDTEVIAVTVSTLYSF